MTIDIRERIGLSDEALAGFCRKWRIARLEVFGSALRDDFDPDKSDLDLLVTFAPEATWTLFDLIHMEDEFAGAVGRRVDMPQRSEIEQSENYIRRKRILSSARLVYEAA